MKRDHLLNLLGTIATFVLILVPATRGEDPPPSAPAVTATEKPALPAATEPAKPATLPPATTATETSVMPSVAKVPPAAAPQVNAPATEPEAAGPASKEMRRSDSDVENTVEGTAEKIERRMKRAAHKHAHAHVVGAGENNERVSFSQNTVVGKEEKVDTAVSIVGSTTVEGEVLDAVVSILGSSTINGLAGGDAVAVMGSVHVNGTVRGDVVAVMGDVELGPNAVVDGDIVAVGGAVHRDPKAEVRGDVQQISIAQHFARFDWLSAWAKSALLKGRLLSFASGTGWAWIVAGVFFVFYVLLALIFPRGIEKCVETLEQRPGFTILTALLTMLAMPLVFLLLAITGIGLLVIPFLAIGLFAGKIFGRAAMLAWFGRRCTGWLGGGLLSRAAPAVLIGGILVMLLYTVPVLALIVSMLIGMLGLGMALYTLVLSMQRNGAKSAPIAAAVPPPVGVPPLVPAAGFVGGAGESAVGPAIPPVAPAAALPRAGFWIRTGAVIIDLILCCLVVKLAPWVHGSMGSCLLLLAAYGAVLWHLRGTTVGGSIFHLKVVRLDDRPLDWTTAIVRALSCFLSLAVVGLGFLWVAFDDEKQSWHDKIAGTTVVKMPKGVSLI